MFTKNQSYNVFSIEITLPKGSLNKVLTFKQWYSTAKSQINTNLDQSNKQ